MNPPVADRGTLRQLAAAIRNRGYLFRRFAFWFAWFAAVVAIVLVAKRTIDMWSAYQEQIALLDRVQQQQIEVAATRIALFVQEIENSDGMADAVSVQCCQPR